MEIHNGLILFSVKQFPHSTLSLSLVVTYTNSYITITLPYLPAFLPSCLPDYDCQPSNPNQVLALGYNYVISKLKVSVSRKKGVNATPPGLPGCFFSLFIIFTMGLFGKVMDEEAIVSFGNFLMMSMLTTISLQKLLFY